MKRAKNFTNVKNPLRLKDSEDFLFDRQRAVGAQSKIAERGAKRYEGRCPSNYPPKGEHPFGNLD